MKQTEFIKQLSKYVDVKKYYDVAGDYYLTRDLQEEKIVNIVEAVKERLDIDIKTNISVNYSSKDHFVDTVKLKRLKVEYSQTTLDGKDEPVFNEIVLPTTEAEEKAILKEYTIEENKRWDFMQLLHEAVNTATNGEKNADIMLKYGQNVAEELMQVVTIDDADIYSDLMAEKIDALEGITEELRQKLYYHYAPKRCTIGVIFKDRNGYRGKITEDIVPYQYNSVCHNFLTNVAIAIPRDILQSVMRLYYATDNMDEYSRANGKIIEAERAVEKQWQAQLIGDLEQPEEQPSLEAENIISQTVIEQTDYKHPSHHVYDNTKVAKTIFSPLTGDVELGIVEADGGQYEITVSKQNAKVERSVIVDITGGTSDLTPYEAGISNALFSVILAGNTSFTSKQVAKQFYQTDKPSPNQQGAVTKALEKFLLKRERIDYTAHLEQNGVNLEEQGIRQAIVEDYYLPAKSVTLVMNNGTQQKGYQLHATPPQLQYCKEVGQIITVDSDVLNVPVSMNNETVVIRDKLLERINAIYNPKGNLSNNILINTLLTDAGVDLLTLNRKKRKQYVDGIIKMLDYWDNKTRIKKGLPELGDGAIVNGYKLNYGNKGTLESITINPKK